MTDDYKRHGTTLFAALDGKVIQGVLEHPARSSCASCARLDHATPAPDPRQLHAAHETQAVKRWLVRHPRFHLHFAPTSASWANAVESFFAQLTIRRLRRGAFHSS
jgi:hypothetical protein